MVVRFLVCLPVPDMKQEKMALSAHLDYTHSAIVSTGWRVSYNHSTVSRCQNFVWIITSSLRTWMSGWDTDKTVWWTGMSSDFHILERISERIGWAEAWSLLQDFILDSHWCLIGTGWSCPIQGETNGFVDNLKIWGVNNDDPSWIFWASAISKSDANVLFLQWPNLVSSRNSCLVRKRCLTVHKGEYA